MHGGVGDRKIQQPMVLGHESSGVVLAVGSRVVDLAPGDLVALEPGEVRSNNKLHVSTERN
jgi:Zn-dependent alcohol dehydrogenase